MPDLDRRLQDYWDKVVESHPTPTGQEILERSEALTASPPRRDRVRTRLLEARPWLVGVVAFVAVLVLAGLIYSLTASEDEMQQPASPPPTFVEPESTQPILEVLLPEGHLNGEHFPGGVGGFQYLLGPDPNDEANWYEWPGLSTEDGNIRIEGVVEGVAAGDWVGIRHASGGQQAITHIIAFTFDEWDLNTASGTVEPAAEGVVMVAWWDPDDPENINGNGENEIVDGIWRVTGLQATEGSNALAYWQDTEGNYQVISLR